MCGPSSEQSTLERSQQNFFNQLTQSYTQNFSEQQGVLSAINNSLSPILQAGPGQMGFSPAENAALTGSAINNAATANRNAQVVAASSEGGNTGVTTGGEKQLQAAIATGTGQALSTNENQINLENAELGRQNFFSAESGLAGEAALLNPVGYANPANTAGGQAYNMAKTNQDERNQEQADIAGAVVGVATGLPFGAMGGLAGGGGGGGIQMTPFEQGGGSLPMPPIEF